MERTLPFDRTVPLERVVLKLDREAPSSVLTGRMATGRSWLYIGGAGAGMDAFLAEAN